jgi:hypothetical protein
MKSPCCTLTRRCPATAAQQSLRTCVVESTATPPGRYGRGGIHALPEVHPALEPLEKGSLAGYIRCPFACRSDGGPWRPRQERAANAGHHRQGWKGRDSTDPPAANAGTGGRPRTRASSTPRLDGDASLSMPLHPIRPSAPSGRTGGPKALLSKPGELPLRILRSRIL